jgi:acyl dehydratase
VNEMEQLKPYQVQAQNHAQDSENKIHDNDIAARFGFRGGLVPGVIVYAYMTVPLVEAFGNIWLERGTIQVKFNKPFYEGETVIVRATVDEDSKPKRILIQAEREDGEVCAVATATLDGEEEWPSNVRIADYPEKALPATEMRREALRENFNTGDVLGSLSDKIDLDEQKGDYLKKIDERLPNYFGASAVVHPGYLLSLANQIFVRNFKASPWIHTGSELVNRSTVQPGERLSVRGRIGECFERKGHEFVVLDLLFVANENRIVQQVRHTAIYKLGNR